MKSTFVLLSLLSLAFASDVLELTDPDFAQRTSNEPLMLVEFFAPWCGHCKKLAPEYEKAATKLKTNDPPVPLAKVDCTEAGKETCGKFGVSGYPTLKIFRNGEFAEEYNGPREADGIVKHMKSKAGPTSKELKTVEDVKKFKEGDDYGVIGFFSDAEGELAKVFKNVADGMAEDMRFGHTTSKEVLKEYKLEDNIVLYQPKRLKNKFEDAERKYKGDSTVYKIKKWIQAESLGLCGHRTQDVAEKFESPLVVAYYDVDYVKNVKGTNYWRNRVMKVAEEVKREGKKVNFAISSHKDFSHELGEYGMDSVKGDKPVVAARDSRDRKFVMSTEFSVENLKQFVIDMLEDKLEPYLKSEAPVDNTNNDVKVVTAKSFDEIVNDEDKDVLIEFYAPWCGHCKALEPKYQELAEKLKDEAEITIAKMDATANDVAKPYEVSGFPTIYFSPKGSKSNPRKYQGGREVDDFIKYLAKESTNALKGYSRDGKKAKKGKKTEL